MHTNKVTLVLALAGYLLPCTAHADDPPPDCGAAELAQAQRDLTTGARLLSSDNAKTANLGLQLMHSAEQTIKAVRAYCDRPELKRHAWTPDEGANPWAPSPTSVRSSEEEDPDLADLALMLGCPATLEKIQEAFDALTEGQQNADRPAR
jgi:hypothetical protein